MTARRWAESLWLAAVLSLASGCLVGQGPDDVTSDDGSGHVDAGLGEEGLGDESLALQEGYPIPDEGIELAVLLAEPRRPDHDTTAFAMADASNERGTDDGDERSNPEPTPWEPGAEDNPEPTPWRGSEGIDSQADNPEPTPWRSREDDDDDLDLDGFAQQASAPSTDGWDSGSD